MSSFDSASASCSAPEKPRIRITIPKSNAQPVQPTPVRQKNEKHVNEISPTPLRGGGATNADDKPAAARASSQSTSSIEISPRLLSGLKNGDLEFPINEECKWREIALLIVSRWTTTIHSLI